MYPLLSILNFKISTKPKTFFLKKTISYFFRMMKHNARLKIQHLAELNSQMKNRGPQNIRE